MTKAEYVLEKIAISGDKWISGALGRIETYGGGMNKYSLRSIFKKAPEAIIALSERLKNPPSLKPENIFDGSVAWFEYLKKKQTGSANAEDFMSRIATEHTGKINPPAIDFINISPAHKKYYYMRRTKLHEAHSSLEGIEPHKYPHKYPNSATEMIGIGNRLSALKRTLGVKFSTKETNKRLREALRTHGFEHVPSNPNPDERKLIERVYEKHDLRDPSIIGSIFQIAEKHKANPELRSQLINNVPLNNFGTSTKKLISQGDSYALHLAKKHEGSHSARTFLELKEKLPKSPNGNMSLNSAELVDDMLTHGVPLERLGPKPQGAVLRSIHSEIETRKATTWKEKFEKDYPTYKHLSGEKVIDLGEGLTQPRGAYLSGLSGSSCWGNVCISSPYHRYVTETLAGTHSIFEYKNPKNESNRVLMHAKKLPRGGYQLEEARGPNNSRFEITPEFKEMLKKHNIKDKHE